MFPGHVRVFIVIVIILIIGIIGIDDTVLFDWQFS